MTSYPGGKNGSGVYQAIINQMPPHDVYIEPFLGSGAVMRRKLPARVNIGVDIDPGVAVDGIAGTALCVSIAAGWPPGSRYDELRIERADAVDWLAGRKWSGRELVYADPPYLMRSRNWAKRYYEAEFGEDDEHRRLLAVLKSLPCMVLVSGYASMLYLQELGAWRLVTFTATTRGKPAVEHLWCNFPMPTVLHDPRYIGADYRDRERIAKMRRRWEAKFKALAPLERQAVLSGLVGAETSSTIAGAGVAAGALGRHRQIRR